MFAFLLAIPTSISEAASMVLSLVVLYLAALRVWAWIAVAMDWIE